MLIVPVIGGFQRHEGKWDGSHELVEILRDEARDYSQVAVRVFYKEWNSHWRHLARQMHLWKRRYYPEPFGVMACSYSWGVGNGLLRLAKGLNHYGIIVGTAVTCDGVYRHQGILSWVTQWRAFSPWHRIMLPPNVVEVHGFYQRVDQPHGLKPCDEARLKSWTELHIPHVEMDFAPEYHIKCIELLRENLKLFVGSKAYQPAAAPKAETIIAEYESKLAQP